MYLPLTPTVNSLRAGTVSYFSLCFQRERLCLALKCSRNVYKTVISIGMMVTFYLHVYATRLETSVSKSQFSFFFIFFCSQKFVRCRLCDWH